MGTATTARRRGMTLVELLVVVAIIGVLAVTVLPNVAGVAESRRSREAARAVSSFIAKAQSRAVGRREWSGFMIAAVSTSTTTFVGTDLYLADVPPVYRGDTMPALLTIVGGSTGIGTTGTAVGSSSQLSLQATARVQANDTIRFGGRGPWFEITGVNSGTINFQPRGATVQSGTGREDAGYTVINTPWPPVTPTGVASTIQLPFEILRQPVPSGSPVSLADGRVIDLRWCGCGPPTVTIGTTVLNTYRPFVTGTTFTAAGGSVTNVLFDGTGRLRQIVSRVGGSTTTFRQTVTGPVFLLVGRADRAGQDFATLTPADDSVGANWQYQDSFWVAIDPASGIAKTAECTPGATTVVDSQTWIRRAFLSEER